MTKHPHDALIRAWLDGRTVQYLQGDLWVDLAAPGLVSKAPHFYLDCSYRLKPLNLRYRLGVLDNQVVCANTLIHATVLERRGTVWLGEWTEVTL